MRNATWLIAAFVTACGTSAPTTDDPGTWTVDRAGTDGALLGVWGSGAHDVWAVGGQADQSLILHGDGARWSPVTVPGGSLLYSVYGFSASDVYAVGEGGLILHFNGTTWSHVASGTSMTLFGLWGASGDDVWIVGGDLAAADGSAVVLRGARDSFAPVALPAGMAPNVLFKAHGFAADDVMLVGDGGAVLRWDGAQWHRDPVPTRDPLRSTWGRGANDVYAVGGSTSGEILHFDGSAWSEVAALPIGQGLRGVYTSATGPTFTVGLDLVFELGRDGVETQADIPALDPVPDLHGVWGDPDGVTYVVGGDLYAYPSAMSGVILRRANEAL